MIDHQTRVARHQVAAQLLADMEFCAFWLIGPGHDVSEANGSSSRSTASYLLKLRHWTLGRLQAFLDDYRAIGWTLGPPPEKPDLRKAGAAKSFLRSPGGNEDSPELLDERVGWVLGKLGGPVDSLGRPIKREPASEEEASRWNQQIQATLAGLGLQWAGRS